MAEIVVSTRAVSRVLEDGKDFLLFRARLHATLTNQHACNQTTYVCLFYIVFTESGPNEHVPFIRCDLSKCMQITKRVLSDGTPAFRLTVKQVHWSDFPRLLFPQFRSKSTHFTWLYRGKQKNYMNAFTSLYSWTGTILNSLHFMVFEGENREQWMANEQLYWLMSLVNI